MSQPIYDTSLWYRSRVGRCTHETVYDDGRRRRRCERYTKPGSKHCPSHHGTLEPFDPQTAAAAIAAFFCLFNLAPGDSNGHDQ